jgi:hypothetical protein
MLPGNLTNYFQIGAPVSMAYPTLCAYAFQWQMPLQERTVWIYCGTFLCIHLDRECNKDWGLNFQEVFRIQTNTKLCLQSAC